MKLIIAEKPDIAKAVSKILPDKANWNNGFIQQGDYCITWCYGHLLTLMEPEDYGEQYSRMNTPNSRLPIWFENWGMKIDDSQSSFEGKGPSKREQVGTIGRLLKQANLVIIAGDVDDEGQLLVEELLEFHNYRGPLKRLDTSALNEANLKKAMANLMDNDEWHLRAVSARARTIADFAFGINGSRFFSNTYMANLSVGRVQTATLGLVIARDEQIENHSVLKYYLLDMDSNLPNQGIFTVRFDPDKDNPNLIDGKILDRGYLESLGKGLDGSNRNARVTKETVFEAPPLPLSISALKSYCSEKYGIDPEETLTITQSLRMNYGGLITYNRSECRYLPEAMHIEAPSVISAVLSNLGDKFNFPGLDVNIKSKAFNDKNVGVHHAIIPTAQTTDISKLTENEQKVYKAICGFYMMQFLPQAEKERTRLEIPTVGGKFSATSMRVISKGFKVAMPGDSDTLTPLSKVPEGDYQVVINNPVISEKETKPPKRYTDASLEDDMRNVAKYVTDPEAKKWLLAKDKDSKEEHGSIGTAATRSAIIQTLKKRGFLVNEGKNVISTQLGRDFYKILPDEIRKPDLTAKWWAIQQGIQDGDNVPQDLYNEVLRSFKRISSLKYPYLNLNSLKPERPSLGICPRCGKPVIEGNKGYGCSGYKSGCNFIIWKTGEHGAHKVLADSGKKGVTVTMAKKLLKDGKVLVKGLKSKSGKSYDAYIVLNDTGKGVFLNLDFNDVPKKK